MAGCLESSTLEPFAPNMTALRVRLINFSKLQMVPHLNSGWNDRHFLLLIPGPASLAPKSSLCIKLGPSSVPLKKRKKKNVFFFCLFHRRRIIGADGQTASALLPDARVKEVSPPAHSGAQSVCVYVCVCTVAHCEHCSSLTATSQ